MRYRIIFLLLLFISVSNMSFSQTMTDNQVIDFVLEQQEKGVDQQTIATKLLQKGVTMQQLRRVRKKYQAQQEQMGAVDLTGEDKRQHRVRTRTRREEEGEQYQRRNNYMVDRTKINQRRVSRDDQLDEINGEIDFFDMPILGTKGKSRVINVPDDVKELWSSIEVYMRNPVINIFYINDNLNLPVFGGMSALAEYSMISDNKYPTYVVEKKDIKDLALKDRLVDIKKDEPSCIIQEVGYVVSFGKGDVIDPLSLLLSLSDDEKKDERIEISIREMLEEYVW